MQWFKLVVGVNLVVSADVWPLSFCLISWPIPALRTHTRGAVSAHRPAQSNLLWHRATAERQELRTTITLELPDARSEHRLAAVR